LESAHQPVQIGNVDTQAAGSLGDVSTCQVQGLSNDLLLGLTQRGVISKRARSGGRALPDRLRKVVPLDFRIRPQHNSSFDCILQFPDISRPVVLLNHLASLRGYAQDSSFASLAETCQEEIRQQGNVFSAFAEGRQPQRNYVQAMPQILA